MCADCGCAEFDGPCAGGTFSTPAADSMNWVVAGRAETTEFLGVRVLPGTEMALRGSVTQEGDDDWTSGTVGCGKATLTGTFQITGVTPRGVRYGYQWFQRMVRWPCDCTCEASTLTVWLWCDAGNAGRRHLREARIVEWEIDDSNPNLGACHGINVNVTWEVEDPRLWLDPELVVDTSSSAWTIDLADDFHSDGCLPWLACPAEPPDMVFVDWQEERPTRPIRLRSDGSWCPIGNWPISNLQLFGGEALAVVQETVAVDAPSQGCSNCANYGVRLFYDQNTGAQVFQTVRWANPVWFQQRAYFPCTCPIRVIETVHIYTGGSPPETKIDTAAYSGGDPGDDEECCLVVLNWTGPEGGSWGGNPAPGWWRGDWHPSDGYVPLQADNRLSGFPPVGCTLVIQRNECYPIPELGGNLATSYGCDSGQLGVTLSMDGRWHANGWQLAPSDEFPLPGAELVVSYQDPTPVTRGAWQPRTAVACQPGGATTLDVAPLVDPVVELPSLVGWCNPTAQAVWAYPILSGGCERQQTAIVTVAAGTGGELRWLRWAIWPRLTEYGDMNSPASRARYAAVEPLAIGEVPILAAGQAVTFDGQRGLVLLDCGGGQWVESEAAALGPSGLYQHPVLAPGQEYLFAVLPHPWATPTTAWYKAQTVEWEAP